MNFDVEAARKAGYSDQEIRSFMMKNTPNAFDITADKFDMEGAIKAGYTEKEIADFLSRKQAGAPATAQPIIKPKSGSPEIDAMSPFEKAIMGIGSGLNNAWTGIQQMSYRFPLFSPGIPADVRQAKLNELTARVDENKKFMAPYKADSPWTVGGGELIGEALPTAPIPGGVQGNLLRRMLTGALGGGLTGALQPTGTGDSWTSNAMVGAGGGGAVPAILAPIGKAVNALMGKVPPSEVADLSAKYGIRSTLGEVTGNPNVQRAETWLEQMPLVGIKDFRKKQLLEAEGAAKNHFMQYVADPNQETTAAMKVANDNAINRLFEQFKASAARLPEGEAPSTKREAGVLLDRFSDVFTKLQDNKVKGILKNMVGDTSDTTVNTGILNASAQPITRTVKPKFSVDDLWQLRKGIGTAIGDADSEAAKGQLKKLYGAVSDDIDGLLSQGTGRELEQFKAANEAFKRYNVKFDALREAFDKAEGTVGAGEMFSPKRYSTILKNLANDPNYKKNVKWTEGEIEEMTGLANILQAVKRGGQYMENPPTGNRWGLPTMLGGLNTGGAVVGGIPGVMGTMGTTAAAALIGKVLTTTKGGQYFARAASKVEPDSPMMQTILDRLMNTMTKVPGLLAEDVNGGK